MIIWLASYPRSGNTYLRLLLNHYFGVDTYSVYDEVDSSIGMLPGFTPLPASVEELARDKKVFLIKTHDLPSDGYPAVYIVRDGRDSLTSYAHYVLKYEQGSNQSYRQKSFAQIMEDLIIYDTSFGGWGTNVIAWMTRSAPTAIIKFEDLISLKNPMPIIEKALSAIGYSPGNASPTKDKLAFRSLHKQIPDFFRRGKIGAWKDEMPFHLQEMFIEKHGNILSLMGYDPALPNHSPNKIIFPKLKQRGNVVESNITDWVNNNQQLTHFDLIKSFYQKEKLIHDLSQDMISTQEESIKKEKVINSQKDQIQEQQRVISSQKDEILSMTKTIAEKENVIRSFHTSLGFWLKNAPLRHVPFFQPMVILLIRIKRFFDPKIGILDQYQPREIQIYSAYRQLPRLHLNNPPVISIVTPSFNQAEFIERTVKSVLDQGYPNLQYVIQDGNSTDLTSEILQPYIKDLTHFESCQDNGQAHAINLGFRHTSGEIMAYLNSDDMLVPGALQYVAKFFIEHPDVDVIYGHRIIVDKEDREIGIWVMPKHDSEVLLWADYIPQETIFWRRRIWDAVGGTMDESYQFALDWDLLLRFQQAGAKIVRVPRFLGIFRYHPAQKSTSQIDTRGMQEMNRVRKNIHGRDVDLQEVFNRIKPYLKRSLIYHNLYRLGIFRY